MIQSYQRPKTIEEAIELLSRQDIKYVPLGGGSVISRLKDEKIGVVDLQSLGLNQIEFKGSHLVIGATATLEALLQYQSTPVGLKSAIYKEAAFNIRNQASIAGSLISTDGRSPFAAAMIALDATMTWQPGDVEVGYGDWVAVREPIKKLVSSVRIPVNVNLWVESVGRTPYDLPIILVAVSRWPSGRTRIVLGGFGYEPILAFDGPDSGGAIEAVQDALSRADDAWASATYRQDAALQLTQRILNLSLSV
jgi:CO/xanthine dehydrogenase FAD-binding subunit